MKRIGTFLLAVFLLILVIAACQPALNLGDKTIPAAQQATPTEVSATPAAPETIHTAVPVDDPNRPESVALMFFKAYIAAWQERKPTINEPGFQAQAYLSKAYLQQLAEIEASFDGDGFDAVLQTQAIPPDPIEVKEFNVEGDQATVVIQFGRGVIETPYERRVSLEKIARQWQVVPDQIKDGGKSPEETVKTFYDWYLGYISAGGSQPRNTLVDRAYRAAPYLYPSLVNKVDRQLESGQIGADPFLCAQDVPGEITIFSSFYNAGRPVVFAQSRFAGNSAAHFLVLDLARENFNRWAIQKITCGSTPEGTAKAFYTWLLGYATRDGEMNNPWSDGSYRQNPFLSQTFISKVDEQLASGKPLGADPALFAQALPQAFNVERCPVSDCALVNMQFGDATIHQVMVDVIEEDHKLKIAHLQPQPPLETEPPALQVASVEKWASFQDEQYGYGISFPSGWRVARLKVTDAHTPEEYPVMRSIQFFSPHLSNHVIHILLEVVVGDAESVRASYGFSEQLEAREINGYPVTVYRSEPGIIYYVFQHPARENTWIILTDYISQFNGREEMAKKIEGVFDQMVTTIKFRQ